MNGQTVRQAFQRHNVAVTKVKKVGFSDLARGDAFFVDFAVLGNYKELCRTISNELGIRVLQNP